MSDPSFQQTLIAEVLDMNSPVSIPSPNVAASGSATSLPTQYAPDQEALASERQIRALDVLAVIEARGGAAYSASVDTGLANRFPFADSADRKRAVERALSTGVIVRTPMGLLRRSPRDDE